MNMKKVNWNKYINLRSINASRTWQCHIKRPGVLFNHHEFNITSVDQVVIFFLFFHIELFLLAGIIQGLFSSSWNKM